MSCCSNSAKTAKVIQERRSVFSQCTIAILTDYRGLQFSQMRALRARLREVGVKYRVVKNTLAELALEQEGRKETAQFFRGPVAVAFGYGEVTEAAKAVADFVRTSGSGLAIKGGFLASRVLTAGDIAELVTLPPRAELLARMVGMVEFPISRLMTCLTSPMRGLAQVLQARINQLEGDKSAG